MITQVRPHTLNNRQIQPQNTSYRRQNLNGSVNFSGGSSKLTPFENWLVGLANTSWAKKLMKWTAGETVKVNNQNGTSRVVKNSAKLEQALMVSFSALLQTNYIINIMRNKKIPEERKQNLAVNNAITFVLPTLGAFTVDSAIDKAGERFGDYLKEINKGKGNKEFIEKAIKGVGSAKRLFVFMAMYRFASTVVATPMADKVTTYLRKKGFFKTPPASN